MENPNIIIWQQLLLKVRLSIIAPLYSLNHRKIVKKIPKKKYFYFNSILVLISNSLQDTIIILKSNQEWIGWTRQQTDTVSLSRSKAETTAEWSQDSADVATKLHQVSPRMENGKDMEEEVDPAAPRRTTEGTTCAKCAITSDHLCPSLNIWSILSNFLFIYESTMLFSEVRSF